MYQIMAEYWRLHKINKIRTGPSNLIQKCRYFIITLCSAFVVVLEMSSYGSYWEIQGDKQKFFSADIFGLPNWPCMTFSCQEVEKQMKQNNSLNCKSIFLYYFEVSLNPVGNGLQLTSGTGGRKWLVTDATLPAVFSYIR